MPVHDGLYFARHYDSVRIPIAIDDEPGLRRGQRGAVHVVAADFKLREDSAVVMMPTGSGKTGVLALSPSCFEHGASCLSRRVGWSPIRSRRRSLAQLRQAKAPPADIGFRPPAAARFSDSGIRRFI